jgi:hypothetical protein
MPAFDRPYPTRHASKDASRRIPLLSQDEKQRQDENQRLPLSRATADSRLLDAAFRNVSKHWIASRDSDADVWERDALQLFKWASSQSARRDTGFGRKT